MSRVRTASPAPTLNVTLCVRHGTAPKPGRQNVKPRGRLRVALGTPPGFSYPKDRMSWRAGQPACSSEAVKPPEPDLRRGRLQDFDSIHVREIYGPDFFDPGKPK